MAVAVQHVALEGSAPAQPRDSESDNFLSFDTKNKKKAGGGAHATTQAFALVCARGCLSGGCCAT